MTYTPTSLLDRKTEGAGLIPAYSATAYIHLLFSSRAIASNLSVEPISPK
ncbi:MAG: hypothetical protein AAFX40_17275 [Cyanobacteria bacterium J06639_1]